jgi:outer membrane receptor protein involved in Fe transport
MNTLNFRRKKLALAVAWSTAVISASTITYAQEGSSAMTVPKPAGKPVVEEIIVTTRLKDSATEIALERLEQPFSAEVLGVEQIVRVGDSDVAAALRRVTGLTLIDGQYVYVRGLGERYSSTTLNGAPVPSPELTRNVIPLDLFPTSILSSVKIHKAYAPDQPAAFGGGNIDIRTRGVPDGPIFNIGFGTGWNTESTSDGLGTVGDGGDLPAAIVSAITTYQGNLQVNNIRNFVDSQAEAATISRDLLLSLNRNIEIEEKSLDSDLSGSITAGNAWLINSDWEFGVLANVEQKNKFRNEDQEERSYDNPQQSFNLITKTVEEENFTGALNFGLNFRDQHLVNTNSYLLRNDEDQSAIVLGHNSDFLQSDGQQRKTYITRLEERELLVHQITGEHRFEDGDLGLIQLPAFVTGVNVNWIYSDSTASTNIPNASTIQASNTLDPATGAVLGTQLSIGSSSQFNFLELEDAVESGGFEVEIPFEFAKIYGTVSGGYSDTTKTRKYYGYTANINASTLSPRIGTPGQVLSDAQLSDPDNGFELTLGSNFGTESYVAGEMIETVYGAFDITVNDTWRLSGGVRWEDFQRGVLPLDLLDFTGESINQLVEALQDPNQKLAIQDDDYYPSLALTYMQDGFLNASNFQLRLGYGKTVVRPDLREVSDVQFIDPELNIRIQGNPNLAFAEIDHLELRAELFYGDGSNLTASLFYKDISNPIEQVERPGPQDARLLSFTNAESGEVYGIEFEGLKELGHGFFLTGNLVLSDSDIQFAESSSQTSRSRRLTGHSEYVVNAQLGFDSNDGRHSASTVFNVFGERVYFGGLSPRPDAYEEPFHSLDVVYSFYPTQNATVKLKLQNLLNQKREFTQDDVVIIEEDIGTSVSLDFKWDF